MTIASITRHFATIRGARQVHYRRAGQGPPVLLLHQSPASSAELLPLIQELAVTNTVIAPDTPGNGLSDPLPLTAPSIDDFANAIIEFMDEIGVQRTAVYGFHTGAACAMALAQRFPARIVVAVANGYTQMQPAELTDILQHYLPPLTLDWNGAHLLWAWSRIRDQFIFFPWYARRPESRLPSGMPGTQALHDAVMDLLHAGNGYAQAYRAAFEYDRAAVVPRIQAPTLIMTARTDALYRYLDDMPMPSAAVTVRRPADHVESRQILRETLAAHHNGLLAREAASAAPLPGKLWCDMLQTPPGSLFALRNNAGAGRPLVFCHGSTGSALGLRERMLPLVGTRPLLAIDLPGNGESLRATDDAITVEFQATALAAGLDAAGIDDFDLIGVEGGAVVAAELSLRHPRRVRQLSLTTRAPPATFGTAVELDEYGLHLLRVWNMVRDQLLYAPWQQRKRANVLTPSAVELSAQRLHYRVLDVLKCRDSLPQIEAAHASYPLGAALDALNSKLIAP
jgi:pimeloyl-ACP methyl ester carboxylesterase